jgi:hypothetical protein
VIHGVSDVLHFAHLRLEIHNSAALVFDVEDVVLPACAGMITDNLIDSDRAKKSVTHARGRK